MSEWISVKDKLPKPGNTYILAFETLEFGRSTLELGEVWFFEEGWDLEKTFKPIAWMPMPDLPKED